MRGAAAGKLGLGPVLLSVAWLTIACPGRKGHGDSGSAEAETVAYETKADDKADEVKEPGLPRVVSDPAQDLTDPSPSVRLKAIQEVAADPTPEAVARVEAALNDADLSVSATAGRVLGELYERDLVPAQTLIEKVSDPVLPLKSRGGMLSALAGKPSPDVLPFLLERLRNGQPEERRMLAGTIGYQGVQIAVPALLDALGDPDEWVRYNAAEALTYISRGRNFGSDRGEWEAWWNGYERRQARRRGAGHGE